MRWHDPNRRSRYHKPSRLRRRPSRIFLPGIPGLLKYPELRKCCCIPVFLKPQPAHLSRFLFSRCHCSLQAMLLPRSLQYPVLPDLLLFQSMLPVLFPHRASNRRHTQHCPQIRTSPRRYHDRIYSLYTVWTVYFHRKPRNIRKRLPHTYGHRITVSPVWYMVSLRILHRLRKTRITAVQTDCFSHCFCLLLLIYQILPSLRKSSSLSVATGSLTVSSPVLCLLQGTHWHSFRNRYSQAAIPECGIHILTGSCRWLFSSQICLVSPAALFHLIDTDG